MIVVCAHCSELVEDGMVARDPYVTQRQLPLRRAEGPKLSEPWQEVTPEQVAAWIAEDAFVRSALRPRVAACLAYMARFRRAA